jgi:hypothetical protein
MVVQRIGKSFRSCRGLKRQGPETKKAWVVIHIVLLHFVLPSVFCKTATGQMPIAVAEESELADRYGPLHITTEAATTRADCPRTNP